MNIKVKIALTLILGVFLLQSCKETLEFKKPDTSDMTKPAPITGVIVENMAGKAKITYNTPAEKNVLYVKALYKIRSGQTLEVRSSAYNNSLIVEGFADTDAHDIILYAVSKAEVLSDPVVQQVKPLEAPIWAVYKSIAIANAFGGYNLQALNPTKANVSIVVMTKNVVNEYQVDNQKSVFTSTDLITSKIRGLDTLKKVYAFFAKDRWGNSTDTMYKDIKPIFEQELSNTKFRTFVLPGDASQVTSGASLQAMWDGKLGWPNTSFTNQASVAGPHMITFDTGVLSKLSRIYIRPYAEGSRFYYLSTMKKFEIYGSANPNLSGSLDASWILLGSYELVKPSGLPYGTDSAEDQASAGVGFNWDVDLAAPKVRYLRVRCLENFAGGTAQSINELKVYGDPRQ